jgi:hypothetical protein
MGVTVEIDELVLDGFDRPVDVDLVSAAFTTELTRLVRRDGVRLAALEDREIDALAGLPRFDPAASPERLGIALARSVHAGLCGQGREVREGPR